MCKEKWFYINTCRLIHTDDALKSLQKEKELPNVEQNNSIGSHNHSNGSVDRMEMDNVARQSRHSLSHLVGSSAEVDFNTRKYVNGVRNHSSINGINDSSPLINGRYGFEPRNVVTIIEPDNTPRPSPSPHLLRTHLNKHAHIGRASAPPLLHNKNTHSYLFGADSATLQEHNASPLQQRTADLILPLSQANLTPTSSFADNPSLPEGLSQENNESEIQQELRQFVWDYASGNNTPSRALALFGVSRLPVSEIRSTCEAFGSLSYFRSEFCLVRNVIFIAYHDLRSAHHASSELKTYLQKIASSTLNKIESVYCQDTLKVMYSVSLTASSEHDESALIFRKMPYNVGKDDVSDFMTSFGAVQSIDESTGIDDVASPGTSSYRVRFFDIQDANHCILEMQSTLPWGSSVTIQVQKRPDSERKRGQDLLAHISKWRMTRKPSTPSSSHSNIPMVHSKNLYTATPPAVSVDDKKQQYQQYHNTPSTTSQSTTPPQAWESFSRRKSNKWSK